MLQLSVVSYLLGDLGQALFIKARSHDPFLRIQFLIPKTGSRRSDGPVSRFRFCGENVGRSFAVCSHDPFFRPNSESLIWLQNDHAKFVGAFHLSRRVSDENRACSISILFFKIKDPFDGRSFSMCSHDPFFGTNKNRILKNGSCERALRSCHEDVIFTRKSHNCAGTAFVQVDSAGGSKLIEQTLHTVSLLNT